MGGKKLNAFQHFVRHQGETVLAARRLRDDRSRTPEEILHNAWNRVPKDHKNIYDYCASLSFQSLDDRASGYDQVALAREILKDSSKPSVHSPTPPLPGSSESDQIKHNESFRSNSRSPTTAAIATIEQSSDGDLFDKNHPNGRSEGTVSCRPSHCEYTETLDHEQTNDKNTSKLFSVSRALLAGRESPRTVSTLTPGCSDKTDCMSSVAPVYDEAKTDIQSKDSKAQVKEPTCILVCDTKAITPIAAVGNDAKKSAAIQSKPVIFHEPNTSAVTTPNSDINKPTTHIKSEETSPDEPTAVSETTSTENQDKTKLGKKDIRFIVRSAYEIFVADFFSSRRQSEPDDTIASTTWEELSEIERQKYEIKHDEEMARYELESNSEHNNMRTTRKRQRSNCLKGSSNCSTNSHKLKHQRGERPATVAVVSQSFVNAGAMSDSANESRVDTSTSKREIFRETKDAILTDVFSLGRDTSTLPNSQQLKCRVGFFDTAQPISQKTRGSADSKRVSHGTKLSKKQKFELHVAVPKESLVNHQEHTEAQLRHGDTVESAVCADEKKQNLQEEGLLGFDEVGAKKLARPPHNGESPNFQEMLLQSKAVFIKSTAQSSCNAGKSEEKRSVDKQSVQPVIRSATPSGAMKKTASGTEGTTLAVPLRPTRNDTNGFTTTVPASGLKKKKHGDVYADTFKENVHEFDATSSVSETPKVAELVSPLRRGKHREQTPRFTCKSARNCEEAHHSSSTTQTTVTGVALPIEAEDKTEELFGTSDDFAYLACEIDEGRLFDTIYLNDDDATSVFNGNCKQLEQITFSAANVSNDATDHTDEFLQ